MNASTNHANKIAELNDQFRQHPGPGWMITAAVEAKGLSFVARAFQAVMSFSSFPSGNDPYGEHDFGSFELDGERLFWKIDCYDQKLEYGSPDPCDPSVTRRIMTIMLASDY